MKDKFLFDKKAQNIIELINLFKNVILISHIFACIWILAAKISYLTYDISQLQQQPNSINNSINTQTWIDLMQLTDSSWLVQYIYSYYFITVTMCTVGYGDIKPTNVIEIIVCTVLMMICCAIFAFTINSIGQIFQDFYQKENIIREKRFIIGNYMIKKGISKSTMKDVYEYLEYYWKEKSDENLKEENHIISQLSNGLREELLAESNRIIFKECSFFKDNFSYETLLRCLPIIQEQRCTPEEVIYDSEIGDSDVWLYFIQQGELEIYMQSPDYSNKRKISFQNSAITIIKQGDQFGEVSFFTGEQPKMSLKSLNFSKLLKIKRSDFIKVIMEDKVEYETFCMIKDMIIFSKNPTMLKKKCQSCNDQTHDIGQCPYLHLQLNKGKIYGQLLNSVSHSKREKLKIERSIKYKQPTLENLENFYERYFQYLNDKYEDLVQYEEKYINVYPYLRQNSCFAFPPEEKIEYLNGKTNDYNPKESNINLNICNNIPPNINVIQKSNSLNQSSSNESSSTNPQGSLVNQHNQQLIQQPSAYMKQTSNAKKNLQVKQVSFQKLSHSSCDEESQEQSDDFQENLKLKQMILVDKDSSFSNNQQQPQITYTNSSSIQSQKLQDPCSQNQLNNKQISLKQITKDLSGFMTLKSDLQHQSSSQTMNCSNSINNINNNNINNQHENKLSQSQKYVSSISQIPRQYSEMYVKRLTLQEINKQETSNDQFDCFFGQFEKMRRMTNYFPYFNYKFILEKINKQINYLNNTRKESIKAEYARSIISHSLVNKNRNRNSQKNMLLSQNFKNYQQQRKDQRMNSSLFRVESKKISQDNLKAKSQFVLNNKNLHQEEKSELCQNIEDFITQEVNCFTASKIDPNTPSQSFTNEKNFTNYKDVQIFNKKASYDFQ
ncbi:cyclic nucleotide-binding domain protein (macronuclear) [Tetrahymena thermophila SB210]|uniref:Cyclic nucleotide-binding domain protein n=1 Tax=Tetrahymena thermophila (strain SB210) TaxID=312017 RepID=Q233N9_TETTS|nr:cyclic nucleotide-binding domain protein [Tetrahymena thermophila SB210]EAR91790.2 cyclic nucleotide-binding domain protein [Tetrahymena thermophila SB210]|eukprot:XP_001012035.2 cyclic nucleotide-binding domain protein [Tetrahymena thermophila SB210]